MDVDTFLDGGFENEVAEEQRPRKEKKRKARGDKPAPTSEKKRKAKKAAAPPPATGGDSSSDEEDVANLRGQVASHKQQLNALKKADPEFYQYLAQSDKGLLEFGSDDEDGASDDEAAAGAAAADNDNDAVDEDAEEREGDGEKATGTLDMEQVQRWCSGAQEDASLGSIKRVMQAFRAACHYGDPDQHDDDHSNLKIMSNAAFQKILLFCLKEADSFFRRNLGFENKKAITEADFKSSKWRKASAVVKSYMGNALHLLANLAEEHTSAYILRRLRTSIIFLLPFASLQHKYLKLVLGLFGTSSSRKVRLQAVLWLRAYMLALPRKATDDVLKGVYRTYAAHARFVSPASLPDIAFMGTSLVELYGINVAASYEHAFAFVAQLAVLLRNALTMKTVEAYREVYCWRTVNCLEVWGRVLSAHAHQADLRPLAYPVTQLLLGAAKLVPSPRWFPIRLRLIRILNALSAATGLYIPVAPLLLELLSWSELSKSAKGSGQCPDLLLQLRLSKQNLKQPSVQDELVSQTLELLAANLALWAYNPSFPEFVHLPLLALRKFVKGSPVERFRRQAKLLIDSIEVNARFVGTARDSVEFAPKDLPEVDAFLRSEKEAGKAPLAAFARSLSEKAAARRSAATASEVLVGGDEGADDSDEEVEDAAALEKQLLPKKQKRRAVEPEEDAEMAEDAADLGPMPDEDDILEDYVMSDEDDDGDDEENGSDDTPVRPKKGKPVKAVATKKGKYSTSNRDASSSGKGKGKVLKKKPGKS